MADISISLQYQSPRQQQWYGPNMTPGSTTHQVNIAHKALSFILIYTSYLQSYIMYHGAMRRDTA